MPPRASDVKLSAVVGRSCSLCDMHSRFCIRCRHPHVDDDSTRDAPREAWGGCTMAVVIMAQP
eukprot:2355019-Prymnesium_polylepis.1